MLNWLLRATLLAPYMLESLYPPKDLQEEIGRGVGATAGTSFNPVCISPEIVINSSSI